MRLRIMKQTFFYILTTPEMYESVRLKKTPTELQSQQLFPL